MDVTAAATNLLINYQEPSNQTELTNLFVQNVAINSTVGEQLVGGQTNISGTWGIYSQLCFPLATGSINATTVQFLIHGLGADYSYWDNAPDYSFIDFAAQQGYTTFVYDRLGNGLSEKPDPIQAVQGNLHVSIAHTLIKMLRSGALAGQSFKHVVGVGHSFGSFITNALTIHYPQDLDAAVLTGYSTSPGGLALAFSGADLSFASQAVPLRFAELSNGYASTGNIQATQFAFFRAPGFDPVLLDLCENTKGLLTIGEYVSISTLQGVAKDFTGPVDVVNGEHDLPNCQGNCYLPHNLAAALIGELYPNASNGSDWYIASGAGHFLNYHYAAAESWVHVQNFIKANKF